MPSPVRAFCSTQGAGAVCHRRQFMPVLEIHLIAGHHDDAAISALLSEASVLFVDILYSDMEPRPIGRARAFATMQAEARWATGGQPAIDGGTAAPYSPCLTLEGRPSDKHEPPLEGLPAIIVQPLKVDQTGRPPR